MQRAGRALAALAMGAFAATAACALDVSSAVPPMKITDGKVSIGGRSVVLPAGEWWDLDHYSWQAKAGRAFSDVDSVFIARVEHGAVGLAGRDVLLKDDIPSSSWQDQPCGSTDDIYFKEHAQGAGLTDCISVRSVRAQAMKDLLARTFPKAERWIDAMHLGVPDAAVRVRYARYAANTFGIVDLFVPAEYFDSEPTAIAWAESLRSKLKKLFERREDSGELPPLELPPPAVAVPTTAPAPASDAARGRK
jgi:hypothetical protein